MKVYSRKTGKYTNIDIKTKDGKLSEHLKLSECFVNQTEDFEIPIEQYKNMFVLADLFEFVRKENGGKSLNLTSGCRSEKYNRSVNGNSASDHMWFKYTDGRMSMDIPIPFVSDSKSQSWIYKIQEHGNSLGHRVEVGIYDTFIHVGIDMGYTTGNYNWRTKAGTQTNNYYKNRVKK